MKVIFQEVILVIDSGGLYDQYTMDTKTARYLDVSKFFTARECADNKINLTSRFYYKLGRIFQNYIDIVARTSMDISEVNMVITCCMLLVGQAKAITHTATPWLLNALLLMCTNASNASMPQISYSLSRSCQDMKQFNWTMGLLKIEYCEKSSSVLSSMTIDEDKSYRNLIGGGRESNEKYEHLRKLSIMMMGEGIVIQREAVCRLLVDDYPDSATEPGLKGFFLGIKSHNGFITGQRRNPVFVWSARIYLIGTFVFSLYVVAGNLAGRDNIFERLTDGLTCITALWFTVFGIIKLQSDDQNIIRNLVLGHVPIEHESELVEYLGTDIESIKVALCRTPQDYGWLSEKDCCYVKGQANGKIEILGGLRAPSCDKAGLLEVDEGVMFDLINNMLGQGVKEHGRMHVTNWSRSTEKW